MSSCQERGRIFELFTGFTSCEVGLGASWLTARADCSVPARLTHLSTSSAGWLSSLSYLSHLLQLGYFCFKVWGWTDKIIWRFWGLRVERFVERGKVSVRRWSAAAQPAQCGHRTCVSRFFSRVSKCKWANFRKMRLLIIGYCYKTLKLPNTSRYRWSVWFWGLALWALHHP